jgi:uncharacterized protein (DUF1697 family)
MSALRGLAAGLGLQDVTPFLQSGNLVFRDDARAPDDLESLLEAEMQHRLNLDVDTLVRTEDELRKVIERNPFPAQAERDPSHLLAMFLKTAPDAAGLQALADAVRGPEMMRADGRTLYIAYPNDIGHSKLTTALIERKLASRGSARNWNTILKAAALMDSMRADPC